MKCVLLSGGMDSAVVLHEALAAPGPTFALSFNYGQRHQRELTSAARIAEAADVEHLELHVDIPWAPQQGDVIPGRNLLLLTMAAAATLARSTDRTAELWAGFCAADDAAFPDCRPAFVAAAEGALSHGLDARVRVVTPLAHLGKAAIVERARVVGAWESVALSWSCYQGGERPCGACGACKLRAAGFANAGEVDPWHE